VFFLLYCKLACFYSCYNCKFLRLGASGQEGICLPSFPYLGQRQTALCRHTHRPLSLSLRSSTMNNVFNPTETADNLKKNGGFIPGTSWHQYRRLHYFTLMNRSYCCRCYISFIHLRCTGTSDCKVWNPFYLGGTSLLIMVNVMMDTIVQIQSHLIAHQYEGLLKKTNMTRRRR